MIDLSGRTALVTGSTRGIGNSIALTLLRYGAKVVIHGSRTGGVPSEALKPFEEYGDRVIGIGSDLSQSDEVKEFSTAVLDQTVSPVVGLLLDEIGTDESHHESCSRIWVSRYYGKQYRSRYLHD